LALSKDNIGVAGKGGIGPGEPKLEAKEGRGMENLKPGEIMILFFAFHILPKLAPLIFPRKP
jgi:hypothetical protein